MGNSEKNLVPLVRVLLTDEWEQFMLRGEGAWMDFSIAMCDGDILVVEVCEKLLAYAQHQPHESREGWHVINRLEIHPDHRRHGYARLLVEKILTTYTPSRVIARDARPASDEFWERMGFELDESGKNFVWSRRILRE